VLVIAGILWWQPWASGPATVRGSGDLLTIAATGDSLVIKPLHSEPLARLLNSASIAVTNLEENLLDPARIPKADNPEDVRWPYGTKQSAQDLRALGFTMLSLANNHAIDYGVEGLSQTEEILDRAGLLHAGAGSDFDLANAPVFAGNSPRRVAMIAVAVSASPESRATRLHGEILGRPGVNALRYAPDVTADPGTFATLQKSPAADASKTSRDELTVSGKTIRKAGQTSVEMIAGAGDTKEILSRIRDARAKADIVILSVHSHEPDNRSQEPAGFLKGFAHAAIDAGASLVIGHGPHQLRGIEVYKGGVIFYSLGNFAFDFSKVNPRSEDAYEAGIDLYRLALGSIPDSESPPTQSPENPSWWESVIATGRFERGVLRSVQLQPIDLGVDLPVVQRGTPALANASRSREILTRLADLSHAFGTAIRVENGIGVIDLPGRNP
jgi:poly-gamma-glutamate capsule biosynthesis protein CapA/YwtB (metallophosphatase superfamily)